MVDPLFLLVSELTIIVAIARYGCGKKCDHELEVGKKFDKKGETTLRTIGFIFRRHRSTQTQEHGKPTQALLAFFQLTYG